MSQASPTASQPSVQNRRNAFLSSELRSVEIDGPLNALKTFVASFKNLCDQMRPGIEKWSLACESYQTAFNRTNPEFTRRLQTSIDFLAKRVAFNPRSASAASSTPIALMDLGIASLPSIPPRSEGRRTAEMARTLRAERRAIVLPILKAKGWTRSKLVNEAGLGNNSVYQYLDGTRQTLTAPNRHALADALGIAEGSLPL